MLNFIRLLCAAMGLMIVPAQAENYPSKPIRLIVGYAPGGGMDTFARILSEKLSPHLGTQIVVENKPGASGIIGARTVTSASPDGYTLLAGDQGSIGIAPYTQKPPPFNTLTDFVPISMLFKTQLQLYVRNDFPAQTFIEFVELVKASPNKYSFASPGVAGSGHMFVELLSQRIGLKLVHVPYPGDAKAVNDVLAGVVPIWVTAVASAKPYIESGAIRPIVTSGKERSFFLPDTPTVEESGYPGIATYFYNALLAPKGTPADIVAKLNEAVMKTYDDPETTEKIKGLGHTPVAASPQETADFIRQDIAQWREILKDLPPK